MSKHRRKNYDTGFNLGDILRNIDITQLMSILSVLGGGNNNLSKDKLSSMLNNLDLGDISNAASKSGFNESNIKSQLAALENRLSKIENGSSTKEQLLNTIKELQNSPNAAKMLNDLMNSNFKNSDQ
ncbi:hypothetical protein [Clostridium kluyveri]|uniref:Uncharacterized protein n=2 Tax=Clostridium kluyveri TaxID=1534 RepID=A5N2K3_CLOK5|nr:hypothetical protein [Clostridium kluyveri]EDK35349.1 Hypothetical protein CKL_3346 [Clostridium kluyveri DSM 555]